MSSASRREKFSPHSASVIVFPAIPAILTSVPGLKRSMSRRIVLSAWLVAAWTGVAGFLAPAAAQGSVVISEFLASNAAGLADEDGDRPGWIELFKPRTNPANLGGWFLTDSPFDLSKLALPRTNLPPRR